MLSIRGARSNQRKRHFNEFENVNQNREKKNEFISGINYFEPNMVIKRLIQFNGL